MVTKEEIEKPNRIQFIRSVCLTLLVHLGYIENQMLLILQPPIPVVYERGTMKTNKQTFHLIAVTTLLASMLFGAIGIRPATAASVLEPGDLAIVGFSFQNNNFSFVLLVDIEAGTEIYFSDAGWTGSGFFTNEGAEKYSAQVDLSAGTVITYQGSADNFVAINEYPFNLQAGIALTGNGDQLLTFQGPINDPSFLYTLHNGPGEWTPSPMNSRTTYLPPGLEVGYTAISLGGTYRDGYYDGSTSGTRDELLAAISNPLNWYYANNQDIQLPTTPFEVKPGTGLAISKEVDAEGPVGLGEEVTYTITLSNSGQTDAEGVTLEDVLPAGMTIGALVGTSPGVIDEETNTLSWSGTVPRLDDVVIEFTADVDDDLDLLGTNIVNTATYTWDKDSGSDAASFAIIEPSPASLAISKEVDAGGPVELGEEVTYTITLSNSGQSDAEGVTLEDTLPAGLSIGELVGTSPGVIDEETNTLSWTGTVPGKGEVVLVFTATLGEGEELYGTEIENTAEFEWDEVSGSDTVSFDVEQSPAKLTISKSVTPGSDVTPGGMVSYTITMTNHGDKEASTVVMSDVLPVSLTVLAVQGGGSASGNTVSWAGSIPGHSSKTIVFTAAVSNSSSLFGQTVSNTVIFTSANAGAGQASISFRITEMPKLYLPVMFSP